jgi:hypothetical protein
MFAPVPLSTEAKQVTISAEDVFQQRRQRLLMMLGQASDQTQSFEQHLPAAATDDDGPRLRYRELLRWSGTVPPRHISFVTFGEPMLITVNKRLWGIRGTSSEPTRREGASFGG